MTSADEKAEAKATERAEAKDEAKATPEAEEEAKPEAEAKPEPKDDEEGKESAKDKAKEKDEAKEEAKASWEDFAPPGPRPAGRVEQLAARTARVRRFAGHEWTLAGLASLLLAIGLNAGALSDPRHTLPQDAGDPAEVAYLIAWVGHAVLHDPTRLWHLNAFFPAPYGLAYSDSLLGYAPFGFVGAGPDDAVLRYNIVYVLALALTLFGAYALARQLGVGRVGATVAAVAFGVAPWRLAQAGHLQVLSTGGLVLALAMLARGHGVRWRRSDRDENDPDPPPPGPAGPKRPGWAFAGWLVATWQLTIGFGLGLAFAYVLLGIVVVSVIRWLALRRPLPSRRMLLADGLGGAIFAVAAVLLAQPYLRVLELYPTERRDAGWIQLYSPPLNGLFTAPHESRLWGELHAGAASQLPLPGEMTLLAGFALYALALAGVLFSVWPWRVRLLLLGGAVVTMALALGTNGPFDGRLGYLALLDLPGFSGIRTPGRLVVWSTLLLALLAAGGVGALVVRARAAAQRRGLPRPPGLARLALLLPIILILVEGLGSTPHVPVPPPPAGLNQVAAPYFLLPSDFSVDVLVMLWTTDAFPAVVNGNSGVDPTELTRSREQVAHFPDQNSVAYLRGLGVRTVVIVPGLTNDPQLVAAATSPIDGLGIARTITADTIVFTLSP